MANAMFEVLSPWAEADPIPARGISPRVIALAGKKIGLLRNSKRAAVPILAVIENKLISQFPGIEISRFANLVPNQLLVETKSKKAFEDWLKSVDAVVAAVGD